MGLIWYTTYSYNWINRVSDDIWSSWSCIVHEFFASNLTYLSTQSCLRRGFFRMGFSEIKDSSKRDQSLRPFLPGRSRGVTERSRGFKGSLYARGVPFRVRYRGRKWSMSFVQTTNFLTFLLTFLWWGVGFVSGTFLLILEQGERGHRRETSGVCPLGYS